MEIFFHLDVAILWIASIALLLAAVVGAWLLWTSADELDDLVDDVAWRLGHYHEDTFK